jgi:hypothetical protein
LSGRQTSVWLFTLYYFVDYNYNDNKEVSLHLPSIFHLITSKWPHVTLCGVLIRCQWFRSHPPQRSNIGFCQGMSEWVKRKDVNQ